MSGYESNLYYFPEAYGLEVVAELTDPHASYSFDTVVIWRQEHTGRLLYAYDSGCSCPSPFEYASLQTLHELNDLDSLMLLVGDNWCAYERERYDGADEYTLTRADEYEIRMVEFFRKAQTALSLKRGMEQAAQGKVVDRGSFYQYLDPDDLLRLEEGI